MKTTVRIVMLLVLAGCAELEEVTPVIETDSGSVRIVEYPQGPRVSQIHRLDTTPIARIGELDGERALLLSRVAGARELDRDVLVIADATSRELRWFGFDGAHRVTAGGGGQGPGEFGSLTGLHRTRGDTLIAIDAITGWPTLSWFSPDGSFVRSARPGSIPEWGPTPDGGFIIEFAAIVGAFENGDLLAHGYVGWPDVPTGVRLGSVPILRYDSARNEWVILGYVGGIETFVYRGSGANDGMELPFGYWPRVAAGPDWYVVGRGDDQGISVHDREGVLLARIRHNLPRPPVTEEAIRRAREASLEANPNLRASREVMWRSVPIPERMPSHGPILVGGGDEIWVRSHDKGPDGSYRWYVFTKAGEYLYAMDVPADTRLQAIGDEHLIAVRHDELDVPQVLIFERPVR
jgi:hypothetical protein